MSGVARNTVHVKICGLTSPADCRAVNQAAADYAGFVLTASRRQIGRDTARQLICSLDPRIRAVGVFGDEKPEDIIQTSNLLALPVIQLHGRFTHEHFLQIRANVAQQTKIWRCLTIPLDQPEHAAATAIAGQLQDAEDHSACPDAWLLDSSLPGQAGGTGRPFHWSSLKDLTFKAPLILAGGLDPQNVRQAFEILRPDIVDCSSGVETKGIKDAEKILSFCEAVRDLSYTAAKKVQNTP